jgi:ABC-type branched-subunit amino acid transport system substrate-binding protein
MKSVLRILIIATCLGFLAPRAKGAKTNEPHSTGAILLGMSTDLGGPAANLGAETKQGVLAALESANRAGGVGGRPLHLIALDDGSEPARAAANVHRLLQQDQALAILGEIGAPASLAAKSVCDDQHALFFAPFSGARALRPSPTDRYLIDFRAGYTEEVGAMIDALIDTAGLGPQDIAFVTQRDADGDAGFAAGLAALKSRGLQDDDRVLHVRYEPNTLAVENALATLLYAEHEPKAVIFVGAGGPCAKFIKLAHSSGLRSLFLCTSFVGSDSLAAELADTSAGVIVTQVTPDCQANDVPIAREYRADLKSLDPAAKPGFASFEGYVSGRMLLAALRKIPGEPTRESVIDAMGSLGNFDLGLGAKLHVGPDDHQACHRVWPTVLRDGAFAAFDWKDIGPLLPKDVQ